MHYICFDYKKSVSFISAGRFISYNNQPHPKRILESAVLLLGYSGESSISQDNREYVLKKGTFQVLFPNTLHQGTKPTTNNQSHFWCHFGLPDGFFTKEANNENDLEQSGLCVLPEFSQIDNSEKFYILFSQMIDEAEKMHECGNYGSTVCDSYIKILLLTLSEQAKEFSHVADNKRSSVAKIKEWLRIHACDGITASEAAAALNYNPDYLSQVLKAKTGMTLCAYLNDVRLKEAKKLLLNSNMTVSEIAYSAGFSDEKYFMKLFKKNENVTPTEYRNAHYRVHLNK